MTKFVFNGFARKRRKNCEIVLRHRPTALRPSELYGRKVSVPPCLHAIRIGSKTQRQQIANLYIRILYVYYFNSSTTQWTDCIASAAAAATDVK